MIPSLFGWVPAIVFPVASLWQLLIIIKSKHALGVSAFSWFLFGFANICLYIYTEKYYDIQAIVAFLGSAVIDFAISYLAYSYRNVEPV